MLLLFLEVYGHHPPPGEPENQKSMNKTNSTARGIRNLTFGGVILLSIFDPKNGLGVENFLFWQYQPWKSQKQLLRSKNVRSNTHYDIGVQKTYRGAQKMKKNSFSQKRPIPLFTYN